MRRQWWVGITGVLGLYYLVVGITAGGATAISAFLGALLVGLALALRRYSRPAAMALLVLGAVPLAILTWWSLITPVMAVLAIVCGGLAIGTGSPPRAKGT